MPNSGKSKTGRLEKRKTTSSSNSCDDKKLQPTKRSKEEKSKSSTKHVRKEAGLGEDTQQHSVACPPLPESTPPPCSTERGVDAENARSFVRAAAAVSLGKVARSLMHDPPALTQDIPTETGLATDANRSNNLDNAATSTVHGDASTVAPFGSSPIVRWLYGRVADAETTATDASYHPDTGSGTDDLGPNSTKRSSGAFAVDTVNLGSQRTGATSPLDTSSLSSDVTSAGAIQSSSTLTMQSTGTIRSPVTDTSRTFDLHTDPSSIETPLSVTDDATRSSQFAVLTTVPVNETKKSAVRNISQAPDVDELLLDDHPSTLCSVPPLLCAESSNSSNDLVGNEDKIRNRRVSLLGTNNPVANDRFSSNPTDT